MVAVVPARHRLARKAVLRPRDFAAQPFISLGHSTLSRYRIDAAFADHGVERQLRVETPLSEIACGLVASGAGLSIVEPFTAGEYASRGVAVRRFEPALSFEMAAVYPPQRSLPAVARDFIDGFARHIRTVT